MKYSCHLTIYELVYFNTDNSFHSYQTKHCLIVLSQLAVNMPFFKVVYRCTINIYKIELNLLMNSYNFIYVGVVSVSKAR